MIEILLPQTEMRSANEPLSSAESVMFHYSTQILPNFNMISGGKSEYKFQSFRGRRFDSILLSVFFIDHVFSF